MQSDTGPLAKPGRVLRWDTPFADLRFPSVCALGSAVRGAELTVIVRASVGAYPAYVVRFASAPLAITVDEMNDIADPAWAAAGGLAVEACTYTWVDSPLLQRSGRIGAAARLGEPQRPMQHFIIAGGDSLVEVLSTGTPTVETKTAPFALDIDQF